MREAVRTYLNLQKLCVVIFVDEYAPCARVSDGYCELYGGGVFEHPLSGTSDQVHVQVTPTLFLLCHERRQRGLRRGDIANNLSGSH